MSLYYESGFDDDIDSSSILYSGEQDDYSVGEENEYLHFGKQDFLSARFPEAMKNFNEAASKGCARAYYFLGLMYSEGLGVSVDGSMAVQQWGYGSENDDLLCHLCLMDEDEFIDSYEDEESKEAQEALVQAEEDDFFAFQLAKLCDDYGCALLLPEQKTDYLERSAKDGNVLAMYALYKYYIGDKKHSEAKETLIKAAERQYPRAMIKMGELYENGQDGFPQDLNQAMEWYSMAKDAKCSEANLHLGLIYYKREEYKSAFVYMKRAAKGGHLEAMVKLGLMYKNGWGTKVKPEESVYWWSQASDIGSAEAIEYLEGERKLQNGKSNIAANNDVCEDNSAVEEEKLTLEDFRGPESGQFNVFDEFSFGSKSDFDSFGDIEEESCSDNNMELLSSYFEEIEEMNASNVSQRDAVKNILDKIINDQKIDDWSFYPNIDSKAIVAANNNYAGRNLPFQVIGIYDDAIVPAFRGKSGIMITNKKLIASSGINVMLEDIDYVSIKDKTLEIHSGDLSEYKFNSKKFLKEGTTIEILIYAMAYIAKIYRS